MRCAQLKPTQRRAPTTFLVRQVRALTVIRRGAAEHAEPADVAARRVRGIFYVECVEAIPNLIELLIAARTEHAATIADLVATVRHDGHHVT